MHKTSERGIALITEYEGFKPTAYLCPADKPTIGYGHTKGVTRKQVADKFTISKATALTLLRDDCRDAEDDVNKLKVKLTQNQFDALVSLVFNCGPAPLKGGVGKALTAGRYDLVPAEFMRWTRAGGKVLKGLQRRRRAETALWRGLDDDHADDMEMISASTTIEAIPASPLQNKTIVKAAGVAGTAVTTLIGTNLDEVASNVSSTKTLFDTITSFGTPTTISIVVLVVALGWIAFHCLRRDRD